MKLVSLPGESRPRPEAWRRGSKLCVRRPLSSWSWRHVRPEAWWRGGKLSRRPRHFRTLWNPGQDSSLFKYRYIFGYVVYIVHLMVSNTIAKGSGPPPRKADRFTRPGRQLAWSPGPQPPHASFQRCQLPKGWMPAPPASSLVHFALKCLLEGKSICGCCSSHHCSLEGTRHCHIQTSIFSSRPHTFISCAFLLLAWPPWRRSDTYCLVPLQGQGMCWSDAGVMAKTRPWMWRWPARLPAPT